jgi:protein involved in polysaccharide export with SLBB domain
MSWKSKLLTLALGLFLVSGPVSLPSPAMAQAPSAAPPPTTTVAAPPVASSNDPIYAYKLGSGDKIRVIVFNEVALSGEFTINGEGMLSLPLIGEIAAAGLTASQVQEKIETALLEGYLKDPKVNVEVLTFRPYYIYGEVTKPGEYPYSNGMTIDKAVATASGYTYRADKKRAYVKHANETNETTVQLKGQVLVQPGDTIRIGERYF